MSHEISNSGDSYPMDKLLARLSEQQAVLNQQNEALKSGDDDLPYTRMVDHASSSNSLPVTPATDGFPTTAPTTRPASATLEDGRPDAEEVLRLKLQLAQARNQITKLDHELAQSRFTKGEPESQNADNTRVEPLNSRDSAWATPEDAQSDTSDAFSATAFNRTRGIWGNSKGSFANNPTPQAPVNEPSPGTWFGGRGFNQNYMDSGAPYNLTEGYNRGDRLATDADVLIRPPAGRRGTRFDSRMNTPHQFGPSYGGLGAPPSQFESMVGPVPGGPMNIPPGLGPMGMGMYSPYQQQPMGTQLSPHASEFTSKGPWKSEVCRSSKTFIDFVC